MSTNPYQTPEGQLTTDDQAVGEVKFFSPSSRINRLRYWAHAMVFSFVSIALYLVVGLIAAFVNVELAIVLGVIVFLATIVCSYILMIQRLHDLNKTGWMCLLMLIPLVNFYLLALLIFFEGTNGRNNYGPKTPPNKTWHWIMAFSMPVFIFLFGGVMSVGMALYNQNKSVVMDDISEYEQSQSDTYPSEYTTDGAVDDTMFSDEALEDGISYETPEEEIVDDEVVETVEEGASLEADSTEIRSETPQ